MQAWHGWLSLSLKTAHLSQSRVGWHRSFCTSWRGVNSHLQSRKILSGTYRWGFQLPISSCWKAGLWLQCNDMVMPWLGVSRIDSLLYVLNLTEKGPLLYNIEGLYYVNNSDPRGRSLQPSKNHSLQPRRSVVPATIGWGLSNLKSRWTWSSYLSGALASWDQPWSARLTAYRWGHEQRHGENYHAEYPCCPRFLSYGGTGYTYRWVTEFSLFKETQHHVGGN